MKARNKIFELNGRHVMKQITFTVAAMLVGFTVSASAQTAPANQAKATQSPAPIAVAATSVPEYPIPANQGQSWLKHLGLTVSQSRMGQVGGTVSAPANATLNSILQRFLTTFRTSPEQASSILNEKFTASGADLYRWNCQSCHGADGQGAAPEINSVIGPVQGTSVALTKKRMEARGLDVDDDMAQQVSDLADGSLRDRLQHGGKNMPSFEYMRPDEVEALYGYLEKLSSVPPTKRDGLVVSESASRVGEHIVRGTCHICHDATGPGSGHAALKQGTIPSLASIPRDHSLSGVVHQVHDGSCGMMKATGEDVMPAYPYFTEDEIAAVYLLTYSPRP
jgi:mono/diheme cytochrome c family protein